LIETSKEQPENNNNDEDNNSNLNPEECEEQENNFDKTLKPLEDITYADDRIEIDLNS